MDVIKVKETGLLTGHKDGYIKGQCKEIKTQSWREILGRLSEIQLSLDCIYDTKKVGNTQQMFNIS